MKLLFSTLILFVLPYLSAAQATPADNLDFEIQAAPESLPDGWLRWGSGYTLATDAKTFHKGKQSVMITPGTEANKRFGAVGYPLAGLYKGKEIELKGYIKYRDVANGYAGLLMRIDGDEGALEFDNMRDVNLRGTADWKEYTIKLPLPDGAKEIYVGALLTGTGTLWVDNLTVTVDGQPINKLKAIPVKKYLADKDREFDKGSGIATLNLSAQKAEDLRVLGLVWGYLKYYHPAVAEGKYNWDYELFRILPKIQAAATTTQRDAVLKDWVVSLGTYQMSGQPLPVKDVSMLPDLDWIETGNLSAPLKAELFKVRDAKRRDEHYYIAMAPGVYNPVFKNEPQYATMPYPDAGFRLLSLYKYWNMIQYYFPYKHLIGRDWKGVLTEFIPKAANAANELEYNLAMLSLIENVHDTHANIWSNHKVLTEYFGANHAAPYLTFVGDKAVVAGFHDKDKGLASGLLPGDVILEVDNVKTKDIVDKLYKHTPASNHETKLRYIADDMVRSNNSAIKVKYKRGKKEFDTSIKVYNKGEMVQLNRFQMNDTCFKMLSPKVAYLYPGSLEERDVEKIIGEIRKSESLVIDLRCYPNTFTVFSIGGVLVPKSTPFVKFSNGSVQHPGLFTVGNQVSVGGSAGTYNGRVAVLVNEYTQSSAEYTAMAFRASPNVTIIGSKTAAADGNISAIKLPGGISTMISGIGVYYPDGKETQRIGIVPDIEMKPTVEGIAQGRDEVLERALQHLAGK